MDHSKTVKQEIENAMQPGDVLDAETIGRIENYVKETYILGLKDGIERYAYFKDGVQYVGTTGRTLKKAVEELGPEFNQDMSKL